MGAWGTSLYANDSACDIRGDYLDKLRRGKTNEEGTQELIEANRDIFGDDEEEPLFWFALADTQWNYGRLLPHVKEKALYFLSQEEELERWRESGEKQLNAWKKTLEKLQSKLLAQQPPEKKFSKYRLYRCKWQLGDVFAYRFTSDYSKEKGVEGQYVIFRKISESGYWPGHIVPVVQVYKWMGSSIPEITILKSIPLLEVGYYPTAYQCNPNLRKEYEIELLSTSQKIIPVDNLLYLGNLSGEDILVYPEPYYWNCDSVGWEKSGYNKKFEHYIIGMYLAWKDING